MGILIDSDVIIDVLTNRKPFSEHSKEVLISCENGRVKGFITPIILANAYYLLCKSNSEHKVRKQLFELIEFLDVLPMDKQIIIKAFLSVFKDFEDSLQNYAAELSSDVDFIVTRNVRDYKQSALDILSPSELVGILNSR